MSPSVASTALIVEATVRLKCSCCGSRALNWSNAYLWRDDLLCASCYGWANGFELRRVL